MEKLPGRILYLGKSRIETNNIIDSFKCLKSHVNSLKFIYETKNTFQILSDDESDIIILDFELKGLKTFEIIQKLLKQKPNKCVILLADKKNERHYSKAMKCGVFDFLIKQEIDAALLEKSVRSSFLHFQTFARLRESESKYKDLIEYLPAMFYISEIHPPYSQIYASPLFKIFGYEIEEWLQVKNMWSDVIHPDDKEWVLSETDKAMTNGEETDYEYRLIGKDNTVFWVHDRGHYYHSADGKKIYWQGIMSDITERKNAQADLMKKLHFDELTNLHNRRSFVEKLEKTLNKFQKHQTQPFAVFIIDLDKFKVINDSFGHLIGDNFLIQVSEWLTQVVGDLGFVARLSGDEFAVLIENATDKNKIESIANEICQTVSKNVIINGFQFSSSASVGITISNESHITISNVLRDADIAMYHAKSNGKNCYKFLDEQLFSQNLRQINLVNEFRNALNNNELYLNYQPIISLIDGTVQKVECLLRWKNERLGEISPAEFIPIAEETGLIIEIGDWVLQNVCQQLKEWQNKFGKNDNLVVAINISPNQIFNKEFIHKTLSILSDSNLKPKNICLEITESSYIENADYVFNKIDELNNVGFYVSTDDFGTGYSSISYLLKFPFKELKIDGSLISKLDHDYKCQKIVQSIINLAHSLDLTVVAEGVENQDQLDILMDLGCDSAQGFYFSKPLHSNQIENLLFSNFQHLISKRVLPTCSQFVFQNTFEINNTTVN